MTGPEIGYLAVGFALGGLCMLMLFVYAHENEEDD